MLAAEIEVIEEDVMYEKRVGKVIIIHTNKVWFNAVGKWQGDKYFNLCLQFHSENLHTLYVG